MRSLLIVLLFFSAEGAFAKKIKLGTFQIPLMVESSEKGLFVDLTKEIAKRAGVEMEIVVTPPARTADQFAKNEIDGWFPGLDVTMPKTPAKSAPIYIKTDFIFYKKGKEAKSIADLKGKTVGITNGYPYDKAVTGSTSFKLETAAEDVYKMKKLGAGRIDAFIVEEKTGLKAKEQSGEKDILYSSADPVSKQEVYYAFQNTDEGRQLAEKFSKAIKEMQQDGSFGKIMAAAQ